MVISNVVERSLIERDWSVTHARGGRDGGHLDTVLGTILTMRDAGVWIELTNLIIPTVNDNLDMIRQMCRWMVENGLAEAPLHFSRFFPRYRMIIA